MDEEKTEPTTSDFLNHDNNHETETDLNKQDTTQKASGYYVPQNHTTDSEPTATTEVDPHFSKETWVNDRSLSKSDSAILKIVLNKDAKYTCADIKSAIKDFKGGF